MPLIYLSGAWIAGIFLGAEFYLPLALALIGLVPALLFLFGRRYQKIAILTGLSIVIFFASASYSYSELHTVNESYLHFYNDQGSVEIRGKVAGDPEARDKSTHLNLSAGEIKLDNKWQPVEGTALLFVPRYPEYRYGDVLLVSGILETPSQFDDFDYKGYLAHQGIYTIMVYPEIEIEARGEGFKPLEWMYSLRGHLDQTIVKVLPEPQASLAEAIILGIRGMVPSSLKADFASTGTTHLLAISGLHLSIIAGILISIGIWLFGRRRYIYVWIALVTIWLYAILTGMHPPVVRGAIMASLFLTAELLGRQRSAITALTFAAAVMVGISPFILWDAAFQLSYLAMAGLIFIFPVLQSLGRNTVRIALGEEGTAVSIARTASDTLSVTLGAIIAVWPVVAYYFGIISLVAPLATFLALPALPGIIITGILAGGLGFIALSAAQVMGWLTWFFLSYMILVVSGLAALPLSSMEAGSVSPIFIGGYYSALAVAIWLRSHHKKLTNLIPGATVRLKSGADVSANLVARLPRKWIVPPLLVIAIFTSLTAAEMPDDNLHISFLNVGEGDAVLIQQGNRQVLVDGGPSPRLITLELGKKMPFWDRTIDLLVSTHPHYDHQTGLVEVLQRYQVDQVLYSDLEYSSPVNDEWLTLIDEKNIGHTLAQSGQRINLGNGTVIDVLNPPVNPLTGTESDVDNNGLVLRLSKGEVSFLLTADIMKEMEWELIRQRIELRSTVLKVAHHGSDTSTTPGFLMVVDPHLAVILVGADNRFGHPVGEVLERLEEGIDPENIFRTDEHGTIEFITDGERLWVEVGR